MVAAFISISTRASVQRYSSARVSKMYVLRWLAHSTSPRLYSTMTEHLVPLPTVEKISDRIIRVLGGNPGKVSANLGTLEAC
jgi:hypothetical protein